MRNRGSCRRISPGGRIGLALALALALTLVSAPPGFAQRVAHRLSAAGDPSSRVDDLLLPRVSPDGEWIVYVESSAVDGGDLWAVRRWGGTPVALSVPLPAGDKVQYFEITPDGRRVVFSADQETSGSYEVFSVPIGGPAAAAVRLSPPLAAGEFSIWISPLAAGQRVVSAKCSATGCHDFWSAPLDGSQPPVQLTATLPDGRSASATHLGPDGERLFYLADAGNPGQDELWSVPVDGSSPAVKLNPVLAPGGYVHAYEVSPDSSRVIYHADARVQFQYELYTVPAAGPSNLARRISGDPVTGGDVGLSALSPDGAWVVYRADQNVDEQFELFAVPADGSASAHPLVPPMVAAGDVVDFQIDAASERVVYRANALDATKVELFSVPITGPPSAAARLNADLPANPSGVDSYRLLDDAARSVAYVADQQAAGRMELWAAPIDGSAPPRSLSGAMAATADVTLWGPVASDPDHLLFVADRILDERFDLWSTPVDGSQQPTLLDFGNTNPNGDVTSFVTSPDGRETVYRADRAQNDHFNLYATQTVNPVSQVTVNPLGLPASDVDEVFPGYPEYRFTPDGRGILFLADLDVDERLDLWIADSLIFKAGFEQGDTSEWSAAFP